MEQGLLQVNGLTIEAYTNRGGRKITDDVSFCLQKGEIMGIVGESGSGKSMTALSLLGLLPKGVKVTKGEVVYLGKDLLRASEKERRALRGRETSMVFQEPMTSLNPVMRIGMQVEETLLLHGKGTKKERRERTRAMLAEVGLEEDVYHKYPHELSGGMRQRVMIAMAMIGKPKILVADEPTTALDVMVQDKILELIVRMSGKYGTAVLFISHDVGVIRKICGRVAVMYEGKVVEYGEAAEVFEHPKAEYTKRLLEALPGRDGKKIHKGKGSDEKVLTVKNLSVYYKNKETGLFGKKIRKRIIRDVNFDLFKGEILGLVGKSGIGKSTMAKAITELVKDREGEIIKYGNRVRMVFQDPYGSLNPAKKVAWILEEPLKIQGGYTKEERKRRVREVLHQVGLGAEHLKRNVSKLSGGQRQRIAIACAIMCKPEIVILDEPVSALDVTIQDKILSLLLSLREEYDVSYLLISHDKAVLDEMCDRIMEMKEEENDN